MINTNKLDMNRICTVFIHVHGSTLKQWHSIKSNFRIMLTCALFIPKHLDWKKTSMHYPHTKFSMLCHEDSHSTQENTYFNICLLCLFYSIMSYGVIFWEIQQTAKKCLTSKRKFLVCHIFLYCVLLLLLWYSVSSFLFTDCSTSWSGIYRTHKANLM
jgi:hypothetical protein